MKYKKIILIIFTVVLLIISTIVYGADRQMGDINNDGKITAVDLSMLKMHLVQLKEITDENIKHADLNEDGKITATDLSKLQRLLVGLETTNEELDINSELIKELYEYIPAFGEIGYNMSYDNHTDVILR